MHAQRNSPVVTYNLVYTGAVHKVRTSNANACTTRKFTTLQQLPEGWQVTSLPVQCYAVTHQPCMWAHCNSHTSRNRFSSCSASPWTGTPMFWRSCLLSVYKSQSSRPFFARSLTYTSSPVLSMKRFKSLLPTSNKMRSTGAPVDRDSSHPVNGCETLFEGTEPIEAEWVLVR
jgi:hypothetical protein